MPNLSAQTISQKVISILQLAARKVGEALGWSQRLGEYPMGGGERVADTFANERSINFAQTTMTTAAGLTESATNQTFSFWIYIDSLSGTSCQIIETSGSYFECWFDNSDDTIHAKFFRTDGSLERKLAVTLDSWHHVCVVYYADKTMEIFIDNSGGSTFVAGSGTGNLDTGSHSLAFANDAAPNELQGHFDELSVFNDELSVAQVAELYNSGTPGNLFEHSSTALVHWWRMGDAIPNHGLRSTSEVTATPLRDNVQKLHFTGLGPIFTTNTP
jgi:hypothetical protein